MSQIKPLVHPTFKLKVPSSKKELTFRRWLAKEDKILLMAASGDSDVDIFEACKQIVTNCCTDTLPANLASFDWEYLFIQLRAYSVGEGVKVYYENPESECPECKKLRTFLVDLKKVEVKFHESHTNKIQLDKDLWITMRYPTSTEFSLESMSIDETYVNIARCITQVTQGDSVISGVDLKEDEVVGLIESLDREQFAKIDNFFATIPSLEYRLDLSCKACGKTDYDIIKGMSSFFV